MSQAADKHWGFVAEFSNPATLLAAAKALREAGYRDFDCHSPFPIHGMFEAMGQKRSPLGYIIAIIAFFATCVGLGMQWWTNAIAYPLVLSGKPLMSYQSYAPVAFAVAILMSTIGTVVGWNVLNKMPRFFHPVFFSDRFAKVTDDAFFVSVESTDPKFDETGTAEFIQSIGGQHVEALRGPA